MSYGYRRAMLTSWPSLKKRNFRKNVIDDLHYEVTLDLGSGKSRSYSGLIKIYLKLGDQISYDPIIPMDINFNIANGGKIKSVKIDGTFAKSNRDYKTLPHGLCVVLSTKNLSHRIDISFESPFGMEGLHRIIDPVDKEIYVATPLNSFILSNVMPCIDQPDISGSFKLQVVGRADWSVTSATLLLRTRLNKPLRHFYFEETIRYPAWQFSLFAGPYEKWIGPPPHDGKIPLVLFSRKSLSRVRIPQWYDLGFVLKHPKDFEYFRNRASGYLKAHPKISKRFKMFSPP